MNDKELLGEAQALFTRASDIYLNAESTKEEENQADQMRADAKAMMAKAAKLMEIKEAIGKLEIKQDVKGGTGKAGFRSAGHWLGEVAKASNRNYRGPLHPGLFNFSDPDDKEDGTWFHSDLPEAETKQLVESVGASGGFLMPVEYNPQLLSMVYEKNPIRAMATVIPMRHRQLDIPVVDQTGAAAGSSRQHGGIVAQWTEEAVAKGFTPPSFRQIQLVAHKLTCYTEASEELLADEAVGLVAFFTGPLGFNGAINWEEEYAFLQGTGAGMPVGVVIANATFVQPRAVAGTITLVDVINMLSHHQGEDPVWHVTRAAMPQLLQLNGPAANPSYVFIPNAREGAPATLFGFPLHWTEKLPGLGTQGDILLADWKYYLIGDRQATTIDSSREFRFRQDLIAWRAVHRVDGQPWLSQPITLADGVWQVSPFVVLGDAAS